MSLDLEQRLKVFLASAPQNLRAIQAIELSHPMMPRIYHLWREPYVGAIRLETGVTVTVDPINMDIRLSGSPAHLDQKIDITICTVDVHDEFRQQLDLIPIDTQQKITAVFREYLSDDLTTPQAVARLQVESISYNKGAATLSAVSPRLNITRTGELYTYRDIPMLRGML
jgi:hypothetical protein